MQVDIRSCRGHDEPIIVDCNNVFRLMHGPLYVWGNMTWQGSIKFINSFPSPRRGGFWALISVLSIENDGVIHLKVRNWRLGTVPNKVALPGSGRLGEQPQ